MATETKKKFRLGLSGSILLGFVLGILFGLFFGEYCAGLKIFGDAFIKLLQMSILPYIVVSLMVGIGRLSYQQAESTGNQGRFSTPCILGYCPCRNLLDAPGISQCGNSLLFQYHPGKSKRAGRLSRTIHPLESIQFPGK